MPLETSKAFEILDLAEQYVRSVGYNGFSFRDLADDAGIKSASVHYHFATKERLAAAVARRYAERFFAAVGHTADETVTANEQMDRFVGLFRAAISDDKRLCLFCILAAELSTLPEEVQRVVRQFFADCTAWLASLIARFSACKSLNGRELEARAHTLLASLEGAMIVSRAHGDLAVFDSIVGELRHCEMIPRN